MTAWLRAGLFALASLGSVGCGGGAVEVSTATVQRETIVATLATNGKVEPISWEAARAGREGRVTRLLVREGDAVRAGQPLAELESREAAAEVMDAESKVAEAEAEVARLNRGGSPAEVAEIEGALRKARLERDAAAHDAEALGRLADKGAASAQEVTAARQRLEAAETEIHNLEERKGALAAPQEARAAAEARLRDAQAALDLAQERSSLSVIRAPLAGVVYHLAARAGDFLHPGDLAAEVGQIDRLRATLYVDEPELGRVAEGMPVKITWDAAPGRTWSGQIERMATQIVSVGSRQVGEVLCIVDNKDGELRPGANIDVEIQTGVAENALSLPKAALQRSGDQTGVYRVSNGKLAWTPVETGLSSITQVEVKDLSEGDVVALPGETPLRDGLEVQTAER